MDDIATSGEPSPSGRVDLDAATAFLRDRFGDDILDVTSVGYGEWSRAFAFRRGDVEQVVRFGAWREDFEKDRRAARFGDGALPVPLVTEIGEALGGHYAIAERARGGYLDDLDGDGMRATLPSLFAALDAMRTANLRGTSGFGGWDASGNAPYPTWREALHAVAGGAATDRIPDWRERLTESPGALDAFERGLEALRRLLPFCPDDRHLIHSDLLHVNVLVEGDRVSAVLDWGCAMYGDFLYDIAWLVFWAPWYPAWDGIDFREEALRHYERIGLIVPHLDERLRCYGLHIGLDSLKYNAAMGRPNELAAVARRVLTVARDAS